MFEGRCGYPAVELVGVENAFSIELDPKQHQVMRRDGLIGSVEGKKNIRVRRLVTKGREFLPHLRFRKT